MANPNMTPSDLQVLRSYDGHGNLQKNLKPAAAQEALFADGAVPAGRCMSQNSAGEAELGCEGRDVPFWSFRRSDRPSGGWSGESPKTATTLTWQDGSNHQFLHFVGMQGLEIATSEFITGQTYTPNTLVAAKKSNDSGYSTDDERAAGAGKIYSTGVLYGLNNVVGVVSSPAASFVRFGLSYVTLYTMYAPPIEGIPGDLAEPTWTE